MSDNVLLDKAKNFAVEIVGLCRSISVSYNEYALTNQLIRSGTSVGANLAEAHYAQSDRDFVNKMRISLKECYESEYWLEILNRSKLLPDEQYKPLRAECGTIRYLLITSINTVLKRTNSK